MVSPKVTTAALCASMASKMGSGSPLKGVCRLRKRKCYAKSSDASGAGEEAAA